MSYAQINLHNSDMRHCCLHCTDEETEASDAETDLRLPVKDAVNFAVYCSNGQYILFKWSGLIPEQN